MTMDIPGYDAWKIDPPEPEVALTCDECRRDIYKGEFYFYVDGVTICDEKDCFTDHALKVLDRIEIEA